jgi:hypothetical protein
MRPIVPLCAAVAAALLASPSAAAGGEVYALCTVRDVTVRDDHMIGTIYRSAVFTAAADYDADISMTPEKGGKVSAAFEAHLAASRGLRKDRMALSEGDEHWCIEAPLTAAGKKKLEAMTRDWDNSKYPDVYLVSTNWSPPKPEAAAAAAAPTLTKSDHDRKFEQQIAEYEKVLAASKAAQERYQQDVARVAEEKARGSAAAQAALDQFAKERAAYEAKAADAERQRQAYREEYKKVMGTYPDQ